MPKRQSPSEHLTTLLGQLSEAISRLNSLTERLVMRLEAAEALNNPDRRRSTPWTWKDAGFSTNLVTRLTELMDKLADNPKKALSILIRAQGRMDFIDFARQFDGWVEETVTGTALVSESCWGGCRRDLNRQFVEARIPVVITKPRGENDVILQRKRRSSERIRAR